MSATALTIGTFDGIHIGHQALVRRCRELAGPHGRVVVLPFDPHPLTLLAPARVPARLTTFAQREALLRAAGADEVVRLEPTPELLNLTPEAFLDSIVQRFSPAWIVEGSDFRFGKGRVGSADSLISLGPSRNFGVQIVPAQAVALADHLVAPVSSTLIRWLLENGRVMDASLALGRPYEIRGTVTQGDRRGRTIGFPTANLRPETTPPADGVYAGLATLDDHRSFACMLNVGTRPTFAGVEARFEVHLINAPSDGDRITSLPEYGWNVSVEFLAWLRDQVRFASVANLISQLARDRERALWHASRPPLAPPQPPVNNAPDLSAYSRRIAIA